MLVKNADFEAAAAEVRHATKRSFGTECGKDRFPAKARFLGRTDDFERKFRFLADTPNECIAILRFAGGTGGYSAVTSDCKLFHHFLKMDKSLDALLKDLFAEAMADEDTFAKAERITFIVKRLKVDGGMCPDDGEANGVGTGVNRSDVNRF
jgi:hypothetical protein